MTVAHSSAVTSLDEATSYVEHTFAEHPERDITVATRAAYAGQRRAYSVFGLNHLYVPEDTAADTSLYTPPTVRMHESKEADLARRVVNVLQPLDMLNPINRALGLGRGTGTLVTCFGIPLDPEADDAPAFTRSMEALLAEPVPDPAASGLVPDMVHTIDLIKSRLPSFFKIGLPDMQGPFNLAHAILGDEALMGPYIDPDAFSAVMERITTLWIAVRSLLVDCIGPEYADPVDKYATVCECSVNMVSRSFYEEHILPHDRRIAEAFGPLHIHPCSGPHVFHATLEALPVAVTEAGFVEGSTSGSTTVEEALKAIGDKEIALRIGQELPVGEEEAFIKSDLDRYADNPRLLFGYTGMHWRRKDRPEIRRLHARLDEYWEERYGTA